ncbi:MAG: hypothetical protein ABL997_00980 [Planctomycetota bacterium]
MPRRPNLPPAAATIALAVVAMILLRLAWVGDDSYITLRVVENIVLGHGPVWNVGERVSISVHPLWTAVLVVVRALGADPYFGTIAVSWLLAVVAVALWMRMAGRSEAPVAVAAIAVLSRAFPDYAVCGLENPLALMLLAIFVEAAGRSGENRVSTSRLSLLAAAITLTRLDLAVLCAPAILVRVRGEPLRTFLAQTATGFAPLLLWFAFSAIYYGSPLPIVAYAKAIGVGIAPLDLARQGLRYVTWVAMHDPLTLVVIASGIGIGLVQRQLRCAPFAIGALLYCLYVVKVGGDFMGGRFFTAPFGIALSILARAARTASPRTIGTSVGVAAILAFAPGLPPWLRSPASDTTPTEAYHGITDERRFYYPTQGLMSPNRDLPDPGSLSAALRQRGREKKVFAMRGRVGRYAFDGGDLVHVIDPWLLDPLLMRLPVGDPQHWRIGHFGRFVPEGYLESMATGENRIVHPRLKVCYDAVRTIVDQDVPVFDKKRLSVLWQLWTGAFDDDFRAYVDEQYRSPPTIVHLSAGLKRIQPESDLATGAHWFDEPDMLLVPRGGIEVRFPSPYPGKRVHLQLQGGDYLVYRLQPLRAGKVLAEIRVDASQLQAVLGCGVFVADLPPDLGAFDAMRIDVPGCPSDVIAVLGSLLVER